MIDKEDKVELLREIDIFSRLREYELDIIADYSEFVNFKKGEFVFTVGNESESLHIVQTGKIGIISMDGENNPMIAQIISGESFGEFDFFGKTIRKTAALVDEETLVLQFPAAGCSSEIIFRKHSFISARIFYKLLEAVSERIWMVNKFLYDKTDWVLDLHQQLLCDRMTGLYNQTYLNKIFQRVLVYGKGNKTCCTIW